MEIKILIALFAMSSVCCGQDIRNRSWIYLSIHSLNENSEDSTLLYSKNGNIRKINLGDNKLVFNSNDTYTTIYKNLPRQNGSWRSVGNVLYFDTDTLQILKITNGTLKLKTKTPYLDENATIKTGFLIIEYTTVIETIETIKSGDWNDFNTWSSARVPNKSDKVIIKHNHKIELKTNEISFCKDIIIEKGGILNYQTNSLLIVNSLD
ncbi:hypothetical protein GCM10028805_54680 [Spirosoma harenae]